MKHLKFILAVAVVIAALVLPVAAWASGNGGDENGATVTSETVHHENAVQWAFPLSHDQCRAVPSRFGTINPDSSDRVAQITTKTKPNGSRQIDIFDVVTGTGVGNGSVSGTYTWVYENHPIYDVPAGDGPVDVKVRMTDRFRVIGNGLNFEISFDWRWKFQVPSGTAFNPGPEFSGVVFPDDPANPTNVSNFKAFDTQGDIYACDPI